MIAGPRLIRTHALPPMVMRIAQSRDGTLALLVGHGTPLVLLVALDLIRWAEPGDHEAPWGEPHGPHAPTPDYGHPDPPAPQGGRLGGADFDDLLDGHPG